jgi:hypothetical protein
LSDRGTDFSFTKTKFIEIYQKNSNIVILVQEIDFDMEAQVSNTWKVSKQTMRFQNV